MLLPAFYCRKYDWGQKQPYNFNYISHFFLPVYASPANEARQARKTFRNTLGQKPSKSIPLTTDFPERMSRCSDAVIN